ncbi:hypothetical protein GCM10010294_51960 [Streptomyces griseoloalbus]|nr:hypothetical protein GCM10010294_51960 [Streptomyces griseoloalbus]
MNGMTATVSESPDSMRAYNNAKTAAVTSTAAVASGTADLRSPRRATRSAGVRSRPGTGVLPLLSGLASGCIKGLPGAEHRRDGARVSWGNQSDQGDSEGPRDNPAKR